MGLSRYRGTHRAMAMAIAAISMASGTPALARKEPGPPIELGPAPSWDRFREIAEQAVRASLVDPGSAQFSWPWGFQAGSWKPMLAKRVHGYYGCGLVNARNRMGGYTGDSAFVVVIDHDQVLHLDIGQGSYSLIGEACRKAFLPPVSRMGPPPNYGILRFTPVAEGIRVDGVYVESPADRSGILQDMIITRINGVALRGLSQQAVQQILAGLTGSPTVELDNGTIITIERP